MAILSPEDSTPGAMIIVGPPEGLVDTLGLPKDVADRLHNILFERKLFTYKDVSAPGVAFAVMQETLNVDAQKLTEAFANYQIEFIGG